MFTYKSFFLIGIVWSILPQTESSVSEFITIATKDGSVRGRTLTTLFDDKEYIAYKGIPYAEVPIRNLRFKVTPRNKLTSLLKHLTTLYQAPVEKTPWADTIDAFEYGNICWQISMFNDDISGDEDCLFLNIYTPGN